MSDIISVFKSNLWTILKIPENWQTYFSRPYSFLDVKDSIIFKVSSFGCKCEPQMIIKEKRLLHLIWLCHTISCEKLLAQSLQSRRNNNGKCCCCSVFISDFEPFIASRDNIFLTSKFSLKNNRSKADSYICSNKEQY